MTTDIREFWQGFKQGFRQGYEESIRQGWREDVRIYFLPITVPYRFCRSRLRLLRRRLRRALSI